MSQKNIAEALAKSQGQMTSVSKSKTNPHFKSKYASLDDIIEMSKPILSENGLSVVQMPIMKDGMCGVSTILYHSSGESIDCGEVLLPLGRGGGAQGAGSSITYARRYSLASILCIACDEDDDGNHAQKAYSEDKQSVPQKATKLELDRFLTGCINENLVPPDDAKDMTRQQLVDTFLKLQAEAKKGAE
jgi:hypothetical protein